MLLGKDELNDIEVVISKDLIVPYIGHDELASVNNVLREYYEMKEEITFCGICYIKTMETYQF